MSKSGEMLPEIPEEDRELVGNIDPLNLLSPEEEAELARKLKEMAEAKEFHDSSPSWFNLLASQPPDIFPLA